ncbi:MAG: MMPL family transporter [Pelagibacteraceae bacterium]|nr:MMPL family transporter [Pelagibacteraceae bacterium]
MFSKSYQNIVIQKPKLILTLLFLVLLSFGYFSKDFKLDASSDTLLLENDPDLNYLREVTKRYGSKDFLVLTYTPEKEIINSESIQNLIKLKKDIQNLSWVHNVITILDIPLLNSSDESLMERLKNYKTLKDDGVDKKRGFEEIISSPVFKEFIISEDGKTTGIIVNLKSDNKLREFIEKKDYFYNKSITENLNSEEKKNYSKFLNDFEIYKDSIKKQNHENILEIRNIIKKHQSFAKIHLGGIPMIADDMMTFIKNDIVVFGAGVFLFIVATLWFIFRKILWIIIPLNSCFFSVLIMMGLLGLLGWKVTVISSNFIALMLILTLAMNIHMSVRYLQLRRDFPELSNSEAILRATQKMFWPILYTVLTTICAFLSLIFSDIKPIIDFGWMMTLGLITSFIVTFTLLPATLNFVTNNTLIIKKESNSKITSILSKISQKNTKLIFGTTFIVIILSAIGISRLEVENSFINYFDKKTEIYKGMKLIDDKLGGTTPLDIIIKFPKKKQKTISDDDEFESWDDEEDNNNQKYWFTRDKIDKINIVHDYLDNLEEVGKVLSFSSIVKVGEQLNDGKKLQTLELGVLYTKLPDAIKTEIIDPYISIEDNEARINLRIKDSKENLRRNELIKKINSDLENKLGFKKEEFKLAGVLILFNNLLQSLFKSQILTLGFVMAGIFTMFLVLFRNLTLSFIGVVPNFIAAFFILGIIGLLGIPLDMMTITIAAITIGIAVDNSIHYIYRFREEFQKNNNYNQTIDKCHSTVGIAILNTSITIVFGFSILFLSNFIPTIYFGIFTGIAMMLALISVLTLLPKLILLIKPFGNR